MASLLLSGCSFANLLSDPWCSLRPRALLLSGGWHWPSATAADTEKFLEQLAAATIQTINFPGTSRQFRLVPCFSMSSTYRIWQKRCQTEQTFASEIPAEPPHSLHRPFSIVWSDIWYHNVFIGCNNIPVWRRWSITGFCSYWPPSSNPAPVPKQRLHSSIRCWTDNVLYFSCDVVSAVWQQRCDLSCPVDCTACCCSHEFIELNFPLFDLFCFVVVCFSHQQIRSQVRQIFAVAFFFSFCFVYSKYSFTCLDHKKPTKLMNFQSNAVA